MSIKKYILEKVNDIFNNKIINKMLILKYTNNDVKNNLDKSLKINVVVISSIIFGLSYSFFYDAMSNVLNYYLNNLSLAFILSFIIFITTKFFFKFAVNDMIDDIVKKEISEHFFQNKKNQFQFLLTFREFSESIKAENNIQINLSLKHKYNLFENLFSQDSFLSEKEFSKKFIFYFDDLLPTIQKFCEIESINTFKNDMQTYLKQNQIIIEPEHKEIEKNQSLKDLL